MWKKEIPKRISRPLLVFDLETTGKNPQVDEIIQFYGILIYPNGKTKSLEFKCQPLCEIDAEASKIHGITKEDLEGCFPFVYHAKDILAFLPKNFDVAGFNINRFDLPILNRQLTVCGYSEVFQNCHILDCFSLYKKHYPRTLEQASLQYLGKTIKGAHDASNDTTATCEVLAKQLQIESTKFEEIANSTSTPPDQRVGFLGHLKRVEGEILFNFGKYKGKPVRMVPHKYLRWILESDFPEEVKTRIRVFYYTQKD